MERIIDLTMTHLFLVAEYVLDKCTFLIKKTAPVVPQESAPTIRFTDEDKPVHPRNEIVEGELFK